MALQADFYRLVSYIKKLFYLLILKSKKIKAFSALKVLRKYTLLRYLIKELLLYFGICFCFFFMAFFINQILLQIKSLLASRAPLFPVLKVMFYCLPTVIFQTVPYATLVGFLMALGRMVCDNEILIFRATGHSYAYILVPVLTLGLVISMCSFMINDFLIPWGIIKMRQTITEIANSNPAVQVESNSVKLFSGLSIVSGDVTGKNISDVVFIDTQDGTKIITALQTKALSQSQQGVLMRFDMSNAKIISLGDNADDYDYLKAKDAVLNVFTEVLPFNQVNVRPQDMTIRDLYARIKEMHSQEDTPKRLLNQYCIEFMNKFSFPFAALFFACFSMPVAVILGKANGQTNGLIVGVIVSAIYWTAWVTLKSTGIRLSLNPVLAMWTPNVAILLLSLVLYTGLRTK